MANDYAYLEATVDEIELNTKKITVIDDSTTYTEEQYPTVEAVKDYVNSHSSQITVDYKLSDTSENPVQNKVVKSAIDGKLNLSGGIMQGKIIMDGYDITNVNELALRVGGGKITNLTDPTNAKDGANKNYVDTQDAFNEKLANKVTKFTGDETDTQYPSAKLTYDAFQSLAAQFGEVLGDKLDKTGGIMTGNIQLTDGARIQVQASANNPAITMANKRIAVVADPAIDTDAANKRYVDNAIAAALIVDTEEVIP